MSSLSIVAECSYPFLYIIPLLVENIGSLQEKQGPGLNEPAAGKCSPKLSFQLL